MNVPQPSGRAQNNWRRSTGSPPVQTNQSYAQQQQLVQLQQQQFMQQQQELYSLQQAQMELQLQQLRMQNLEMQERIMAASSGQHASAVPAIDTRSANRRSALMSGLHMPTSAPSSASYTQTTFHSPDEAQDARRGALQHLRRAQQHRSNSGDSDEVGELRNPKRGNRLSFVGGEGLAEHALARKRSGAFSPPARELTASPLDAIPPAHLHHRKTSSASSSSTFFKVGDKLMSPPSGPTLVLSEPGDKYPSPAIGRSSPPRQLNVNTHHAQQNGPRAESDASSPHSSDTDSNSEVASFESVTTVGSEIMKVPALTQRAVSESAASLLKSASLNPAASAFTPGGSKPSAPLDINSVNDTKRSKKESASSLGLNYPSQFSHSPGFRNFTAPPAMNHGAFAMRQPKGPAKEDELEQRNFNGRMRKKALHTLNRRSFVPVAPVDVAQEQ